MSLGSDYQPEFESLKTLLLDIAQECSVNTLTQMIADRLAERPHISLVRIWLIQPGDLCPSCSKYDQCVDQARCFHLVASAHSSITHSREDSMEPSDQRLPFGLTGMNGESASGDPRNIVKMLMKNGWISPKQQNISLGLQPLIYKEEILGVIALYSRIPVSRLSDGHIWLRMISNHAAIAITNATAFEQIEHLKKQLEMENTYLREELDEVQAFGDIIGESPPIQKVLEQIELVAPTEASVLILGESGTGKELVARRIHKHSPRGNRAMIKVNCANIPKDLYESEFFGHVRGAFTGAVKSRAGRFQAANRGTLFLDEIAEIPLSLQSKLLRVLQDGTFERLGEGITREVDVRIIAATNRELRLDVEKGRFRRDLYYRLNVFPIEVAPLRSRKEDIPLLTAHFLQITAKKMNRPVPVLTKGNIDDLTGYSWPGNVRELENVVERAVIISRSGKLHFELPEDHYTGERFRSKKNIRAQERGEKILKEMEIRDLERRNIIAALQRCDGKIYGPVGAARILGLKPTTLSARIKKMHIRKGVS